MQKCSKCNETKDVSEFPKTKKKRAYYCLVCHRSFTKAHYSRNKEQYKNRNREQRKRVNEKYAEYLKKQKCVDCGLSDFRVLEFDHIRDKKASVSFLVNNFGSWETVLSEIEKCEVVCANCHRVRTYARMSKTWRKN